MNIIEKIRALWAVKTFVDKERKLIMDMPNIKTGLLTTQFWIAAIPTAVALWGQLKGFIPQPYATYIEIACVALYTVSRTIHVATVQIQALKSQSTQTTVTTTEPVTTVTTPA